MKFSFFELCLEQKKKKKMRGSFFLVLFLASCQSQFLSIDMDLTSVFLGTYRLCLGYANVTSPLVGWVLPVNLPCLSLELWSPSTLAGGSIIEIPSSRTTEKGKKTLLCASNAPGDVSEQLTSFLSNIALVPSLSGVLVTRNFASLSDAVSEGGCVFASVNTSAVSISADQVLQQPTITAYAEWNGGSCWPWDSCIDFQYSATELHSTAAYFFNQKPLNNSNIISVTSSAMLPSLLDSQYQIGNTFNLSVAAAVQLLAVVFENSPNVTAAQELCDNSNFFGSSVSLAYAYLNGCIMRDAINSAFNVSAFGTNVYVSSLNFSVLNSFVQNLIATFSTLQTADVSLTIINDRIYSVQQQLSSATSVLSAYTNQIGSLRAHLKSLYEARKAFVASSLHAIELKLQGAIATLALSEASLLFRIFSGIGAIAAGEGAQVFAGLSSIAASVNSLDTNNQKYAEEIKSLKKSLQATRELWTLLANMSSLQITDDPKNLPSDISAFTTASSQVETLKTYIGALNSYLGSGFSVKEVLDLSQIIGVESTLAELVGNWLDQTQIVLRLQAQLNVLQQSQAAFVGGISGTNTSVLQAQILSLQNQVYEWLTLEVASIYFLTLSRPQARSFINTAQKLNVVELQLLQTSLEQNFTLFKEAFDSSPRSYATARYELTGFNFSSLASEPLSFFVAWPSNSDGSPNSSNYNARVVQADVVWNFADGCQVVNLQSQLYKFGHSSFLTASSEVLSFAHDPAIWTSTMGCLSNRSCFVAKSESTSSSYVQYSPYGLWNISITTLGADLSNIIGASIYFTVYAQQKLDTPQTNLFQSSNGPYCTVDAPCDYPWPSVPPQCGSSLTFLQECDPIQSQPCSIGLRCRRHSSSPQCGGNMTNFSRFYCV